MTVPAGPRPRRWWWVAALTAIGVAAVVGVVVLATGREATPPNNPCDPAARKRTGVTRPVAGASGGLRVMERGFTQLDRDRVVSLGAMVQNTSSLVAYRTRIRFRVFDAKHRSAVSANSGELLIQEIPVILPGQRVGVGASTFLREDELARPAKVSGFEIDLGAPQWWPQDNDVHTFRPISTRHQRIERSSVDLEEGDVSYSVESALCRAFVSRGVASVFRDSHGKLVGGGFWRSTLMRCVPGKYFESINQFAIPPGIDDSRTESYPYCDPAPFRPDPLKTDNPFN